MIMILTMTIVLIIVILILTLTLAVWAAGQSSSQPGREAADQPSRRKEITDFKVPELAVRYMNFIIN